MQRSSHQVWAPDMLAAKVTKVSHNCNVECNEFYLSNSMQKVKTCITWGNWRYAGVGKVLAIREDQFHQT